MDPALWLLAKLRFRGWLRRLGRNVRTVKGALFAAVGVLVLLGCLSSWAFSLFMVPALPDAQVRLEQVRQVGPLALLGLCLLHLVTSSAERAVIPFTPAEVDFLFAGPFSRRQLLAYKLLIRLLSTLVSATFFLVGITYLRAPSVPFLAKYLGMVLALAFVQLLAITLGFLASAVGVRAYNRGRKAALGLVLVLAVVAIVRAGDRTMLQSPEGFLDWLQQTPAIHAALEPLRWFVWAFTAECLWPDFAQWALLSLAVNAGLVLVVFALDAHYLETAAAFSERLYAQLQRARTGGAAAVMLNTSGGKPRFSLPSLPWLGGIGPVAWRQLVAVPRSRATLVVLILFVPLLVFPLLAGFRQVMDQRTEVASVLGSQVVFLTVFLSFLITFDFRGDVDRMDVLKALPIAPVPLVLGQLVAPVLITSLFQWTALGVVMAVSHRPAVVYAFGAAAPFVVPFNFVLFGLDNLLFLLFPARTLAASAGDFQAMGRQVLLSMGKFFFLGVSTGVAALVALPVYFLTGQRLWPALAAAWLVLAGFAAGLVPLLALAFRRYDVTRDTPP